MMVHLFIYFLSWHSSLHIKLIVCLCVFHSEEQSSKVKMYMADILASVVQEAESLSQEVMDAILVNIVEPNKVGRWGP